MVSLVYSGVTFENNTRSKYSETYDHFKVPQKSIQLKVVVPDSSFLVKADKLNRHRECFVYLIFSEDQWDMAGI